MRTVILYKIMPLVPQVAAPVMMDRARLAMYVTTCQRRRSPLAALRQLPSSPLLPSPLLSILLFSPPPSLPPLPLLLCSPPRSPRRPQTRLRGIRERCQLPSVVGAEIRPQKHFRTLYISYIFVHFSTEIVSESV